MAYELRHRLADNAGNQYRPDNDLYMTYYKTENSNGKLTIEIIERLSYQALECFQEIEGVSLLITLKGIVETQWANTQEVSIVEMIMYQMIIDTNLCEFDIMAGGITPKSQPLYAFL